MNRKPNDYHRPASGVSQSEQVDVKFLGKINKCPLLKQYIEDMCPVTGGSFQMGTNDDPSSDRYPQRTVRIADFYIGKMPVSNALWDEYCNAVGLYHRKSAGHPSLPVTNVSWIDIQGEEDGEGFCGWAERVTGIKFSLPSEGQFEYVARNGGQRLRYPWGNDWDPKKLWCSTDALRRRGPITVAVSSRSSFVFYNKLGVADLVGNVWQWCFDEYRKYGDNQQSVLSRRSSVRCVRGGPWNFNHRTLFESAFRYRKLSTERTTNIGFRLVAPAALVAQPEHSGHGVARITALPLKRKLSSTSPTTVRITGLTASAETSVTGGTGLGDSYVIKSLAETVNELIVSYPDGTATSQVFVLPESPSVSVIARPKPTIRRSSKGLSDYPHLLRYVNELVAIPRGEVARLKHGVSAETLMGATPVTVALWREYCQSVNLPLTRAIGGSPDLPVTSISWIDIIGLNRDMSFTRWFTDMTGMQCSLPTEAQMRFAAVGTADDRVPWGTVNDESLVMWCSTKTKRTGPGSVYRTRNIYRNKFGLTDMIGNVRQWCFDYDDDDNPLRSGQRMAFGDSWDFVEDGDLIANTWHRWEYIDVRRSTIGFRIVCKK